MFDELMFDACSGDCDNGEAASTTLPSVEITVTDNGVFLTDDGYTYLHDSGTDDGEPGSSRIYRSNLQRRRRLVPFV